MAVTGPMVAPRARRVAPTVGGMTPATPSPPRVRQLRLVVEADDFDAAVRFYRDVLGLPEELAVDSEGSARVMILDAGRATVELANPAQKRMIDDLEVGRQVAPALRVAFEVEDTAAATRSLVDAGARLVAEPVETPWRSLNAPPGRAGRPAHHPVRGARRRGCPEPARVGGRRRRLPAADRRLLRPCRAGRAAQPVFSGRRRRAAPGPRDPLVDRGLRRRPDLLGRAGRLRRHARPPPRAGDHAGRAPPVRVPDVRGRRRRRATGRPRVPRRIRRVCRVGHPARADPTRNPTPASSSTPRSRAGAGASLRPT